jgi:hypothetical protein
MSSADQYNETARAYADGLRELLASPGAAAGERGGRGPTSYDDATFAAEGLDKTSKALTRAAAAGLESDSEAERQTASLRLLAKALADLEVSAHLLQLGIDEQDEISLSAETLGERSGSSRSTVDDCLAIITGELIDLGGGLERGGGPAAAAAAAGDLSSAGTVIGAGVAQFSPKPTTLPAARAALSTAIIDASDLVSDRAARSGQKALSGLMGLGVGELGRAAGAIGGNLAAMIGQADRVSSLMIGMASFAGNAYTSIETLLGPQLTQVLASQVTGWVDELRGGERMSKLVAKLYETDAIIDELQPLVSASPAQLEAYQEALAKVEGLEMSYAEQVKLAEKILDKMRFLSGVPVIALPQGQLLVAAVYILLAGYVVAAGGDHLSAEKFEMMKRVEGLRIAVESRLGTPDGAAV